MKFLKQITSSFIKKSLFRSIALIAAIGIALFVCLYMLFAQYTNDSIALNEKNKASKAAVQISDYFSQVSSYSFSFSDTFTIPEYMLEGRSDQLNSEMIEQSIKTHIVSSKFLSNVTVENSRGDVYVNGNKISPENYNIKIGEYLNCEVYTNTDSRPERMMFKYTSPTTKFRTVSIVLKTKYLSELILEDGLYVVNEEGTIVLSRDTDDYGLSITNFYGSDSAFEPENLVFDNSKFNINLTEIEKSNFYVISIISKSQYSSQFTKILLISLAISVSIMTVSILIITASWRKPYRRIANMVDTFKYHFPTESVNLDELAYINSSIIKTLEKNQQSEEKLSEAVLEARAAQAKAVYSQISPHFIANSLDNIKWQSILALGINNNISKSIVLLNRIISEYMQQHDMISTIECEMEITETCAQLYNMRFKIPFKIEYDIDERLRKALIIKLTIQPFIENTVMHSFSADRENQKIMVSVKADSSDALKIIISDNGKGIAPARLQDILKSLKDNEPPKKHIGIKNVHIRYRLLYGNDFGITDIKSNEKGTTVTLKVPYVTKLDNL